MISNRALVITGASLAGAAVIVGICIYYDRKRRNDPNYKQKIRERRSRNEQMKKNKRKGTERSNEMPTFNNPTEAQAFFLQEVQLGEELLSEGDNENAVDHLYNAVKMCGAPNQLLEILRQTLPPVAYTMLLERLESAGRPASGVRTSTPPLSSGGGAASGLVEDEVE